MSGELQKMTNKPFYAKWSNVPFAPAKWPFFYGWTIVAVSTLSIIGSIPGQTFGVSGFTDYIIEALGISRNQLSVSYMIGTIISGCILPFAGKLLDRIGVRFMSAFASLGLGASLILLATIGRWSQAVSTWLPTMAAAAFSFFLIRFFGQGNMTMVGRVAMGRWFNHWRGMATAIAGVPIAFVFNASPWIIVGIGISVIGLLFFRDTPEECGLLMDGKKPDDALKKTKPELHPIHRQFTRREAVRTVSFWAYALGLAAHGLIATAILFHLTSIGDEMGRSRDESVKLFLYSSFLAIPTRLQLRWMLMLMAGTMFTYTFTLTLLSTPIGWLITPIMYGITGGIWGVLGNVPMPRYFGRQHLGAISGLMMSILVIASALGPAMFSYGKYYLGSYRNAAHVILLLPAAVFVLSFLTSNPQRKYEQVPEV